MYFKKPGEKKWKWLLVDDRHKRRQPQRERRGRGGWWWRQRERYVSSFIWRDDRVFVTQKQASPDFPKCRSGLVCDRPSFQHIFFYVYIHSSCKDLHNQTVAVYIQLLFSTGKYPAADTMVNALVMSKFPQSEVCTSGFYGRQSYLSSL
jgi:hypothetical protein